MECSVNKSKTRNTLKQISFGCMEDNQNGNNIKMLINFNSKLNYFN
jgi:hypothetical protein